MCSEDLQLLRKKNILTTITHTELLKRKKRFNKNSTDLVLYKYIYFLYNEKLKDIHILYYSGYSFMGILFDGHIFLRFSFENQMRFAL